MADQAPHIPVPDEIEASSGITYGTSDIGEEAFQNALEGLGGTLDQRYKVDVAREVTYTFTLRDTQTNIEASQAIGGGLGDRYHVPRCWCGSNKDGTACKHIFWLWDQILKTLRDNGRMPEQSSWHFRRDGLLQKEARNQSREAASLDAIIEALDQRDGFQNLIIARDWTRGRVEHREQPLNSELAYKMKRLRDLMEASPEKKKLFEEADRRNEDLCTNVLESFGNLVQEHARQDAEFQESLVDLIQPDFTITVDLVNAQGIFQRLSDTGYLDDDVANDFHRLLYDIEITPDGIQLNKQQATLKVKLYAYILEELIQGPFFTERVVHLMGDLARFLGALRLGSDVELRNQLSGILHNTDMILSRTEGADQWRRAFGAVLARV